MEKGRATIILPLAVLYSFLVLGLTPQSAQANKGKNKPDFLLITIDTLRTDRISFYSPKHLKTPNLDSLAARSIVFTRGFAHTTSTLPSHANILLGTTPCYHGVHDNANFIVRAEFLTLAEHLKSYGYATGAFVGGFPLDARFGLNQGFDVYDDNFGNLETNLQGVTASGGERNAQAVLDSALKWLQGRRSPWFLWLHFYDPHDPYLPPEPFRSQNAGHPYDGEVAYVDSVMGNLLRYLEDNGLFDSTVIVCTGDHGESLGEHGEMTHGFLAYNATLWIPLFIFCPGQEHRVVSQNVSHIDIFPTVCDVLGVKKPGFLQGLSLLPFFEGKKSKDEEIYFEALSPFFNMAWAPIRGYIFHSDKFIDSPIPELYDLDRDFEEKVNLGEGKNLAVYKSELDRILEFQSSAEGLKAGEKSGRETLERLRSLGYLAGIRSERKKAFTAEDDVKLLLPYHSKALEALELFNKGKPGEAVEILKEILTAKRNISTAYLSLASVYGRQGRLDDAVEVLRTGLAALPENYYICSEYFASLYRAGRFEQVIADFDSFRPPQSELDPVIWNYVGLAYEKKGEVMKAKGFYEKSLSIDPKFAVTYKNLGTLYFFSFRKSQRPEDYERSVKNYQKAVELDPAYSDAFHGLGVAYLQSGKYAEAVASLKRGLELNRNFDEAYYFLGVAYFEMGNTSEAYRHLIKYKSTPSYNLLSPAAKAAVDDLITKCNPGSS